MSRLSHFEDLVKMLRSDVASFGDSGPEDHQRQRPLPNQLHIAGLALSRVEGILDHADTSQPAFQELRRLYEAVAPLIQAEEIAS